MNSFHYIFIAVLLCHSLKAQNSLRDAILNGSDRKAILKQQVESLGVKSQQDLIAQAINSAANKESRIAAAVLLLRNNNSQQAVDAALGAMNLEMPAGLNDWEDANDWTLSHPVAAETALHPDLMPQIVQRTLSGELKESVVGFVLLHYQSEKVGAQDHLADLLGTNLGPDQRQRCERLLALLKSETPTMALNTNATLPAKTSPPLKSSAIVQTQAAKRAPESKPAQTSSKEPPSSTPWPLVVVMILAASGLLWLLLKRRS